MVNEPSVFEPLKFYCMNKINKLQGRASKIIFGREYINLEESRKRLKLLSFEESVFLQKAKMMYKIAKRIAPKYLLYNN